VPMAVDGDGGGADGGGLLGTIGRRDCRGH
jgi:hypothetical protein